MKIAAPVGIFAASLTILAGCALETEGYDHSTQATSAIGASKQLVSVSSMSDMEMEAKFRDHHQSVETEEGEASKVVVVNLTLEPGGETGWHTHDGIEIISVNDGTLTLFEGDKDPCAGEDFYAGESFMLQGGPNHNARNLSDQPVSLTVIFVVPPGGQTRHDLPAPAGEDQC